MKNFALKASLLAMFGGLAMISGQASAHQTYNITTTSSGLGLTNSLNNTDGISNFSGYSQGGGTAAANHWIPGTGGLPADYYGTLPFNWYAGHHDTTSAATTTRSQSTGTSETSTNSLWKAAYTDTTNTWTPYAPQTTNAAGNIYVAPVPPSTTATFTPGPNGVQHPYLAVGANSFATTSTSGGLDYGLIHASCGANTSAFNCTTPETTAVGSSGYYNIHITVARDTAYDTAPGAIFNSTTDNNPDALLAVALYRGSDTSIASNRTAAFDPNAVGVQGSTLGTGGANGEALLWTATQSQQTDVLSFDLKITSAEWALTDKLLSNGLTANGQDDGAAGYYTLIIGGITPNGLSSAGGIAYTVNTVSTSVPIPAAVWLFGSALGGLGVFGRRKAAKA